MEFPYARLLIFAKAPVPGQVKTRLASKFGQCGAADLYKTMLRQTLNMTTSARLCSVQLWCAPDAKHSFFAACRRDYGITLRVQQGQDLGKRMDHALATALADSPYAVLIGSDCASLQVAELRLALAALAKGQDAVLGPTEDGGYLLIGLRQPRPQIFRNIVWGSPQVLAATRRRMRRIGLDWIELPLGWDLDHPADVRRWRRLLTHRSRQKTP